jgi:hypothetical protein
MKAAMSGLFKRRLFKRSEGAAREIDEELRFHLELLTQAYLQQDTSVEEAKAAAERRLGNVERIKDQCLAISRRSHPVLVALKSFLLFMLLAGVVVRVLSTDLNIRTLGQLLIAVPILSGLLLYVRSLSPSSFLAKPETAPLGLNETVQPLFAACDQGTLRHIEPVEYRASYFR